ncbi:exported hypothetical protein [Thiomonas sp. X19]|uniref:hypothetical protein n=1 Tax=Thiomonas sp. X19 TaxID=1050370 RepID=UPI000B74CBB6|nr:hypothetical protein [Thiomonas sp. X19]SCC94934.1 exported hypothetical protein [Thiomonas sp. X19]
MKLNAKTFTIAAVAAAIFGLAIGAAMGQQHQAAQVHAELQPSSVALRPDPVPVKPGGNFAVMVTPGPDSLLRLALDTRNVESLAAAHNFKVAVAAVCDAKCQKKLQALPSLAMTAQSFGVQFVPGNRATLKKLVAEGWTEETLY